MSKFKLATTDLIKVSLLLIKKDFSQKPTCADDITKPVKNIIIDKKGKTYFFADDQALKYIKTILCDKYKNGIKPTTLKKIKNWN